MATIPNPIVQREKCVCGNTLFRAGCPRIGTDDDGLVLSCPRQSDPEWISALEDAEEQLKKVQ